MLVMDSEGFISIYNLPDLRLLYKEDCVDASDAVGQRHFVCSPNGVLLHQRSPSEFTHGSITEEARMEFHFMLPSKNIMPLMLTPTTPNAPMDAGAYLQVCVCICVCVCVCACVCLSVCEGRGREPV